VPELSRFYGIVIRMYFGDHNPPHFHAYYEGNEALIEIATLSVIAGNLSPRAMGLVAEWTLLHRRELEASWGSAGDLRSPGMIEPLS
jgi:hypothetical protein